MVRIAVDRRTALAGAALLIPAPAWAADDAAVRLAQLERQTGARIGLAALDTGNGRSLSWRQDERFLMCSSFKLSLAAAVLAKAGRGEEQLDRLMTYTKDELLAVSPATTRNLATGMTVEALCEAAAIYSDNTAANLLMRIVGGPAGVTAFWRGLGDGVSRLDRTEPALNLPDGDKDTTTPAAMLSNLQRLTLGTALPPTAREKLTGWMLHNTTGDLMLRAGLPKDWCVGDKTGRYVAGAYNAAIDLGIATPPGRKPILIAAFSMNGRGDDAAHQALVADMGRVVAEAFA
jgi:beta-lactamase class A